MHWAAYNNSVEMAQILHDHGGRMDIADQQRDWIPLQWALARRSLDAARFFFDKGVDINRTDAFGNTLLHSVTIAGDMEMIRFIVDRGADLNVVNERGEGLLFNAAHAGSLEIIAVSTWTRGSTSTFAATPIPASFSRQHSAETWT